MGEFDVMNTSLATVKYHSNQWAVMSLSGWVTKEVSADGIAIMIYQDPNGNGAPHRGMVWDAAVGK